MKIVSERNFWFKVHLNVLPKIPKKKDLDSIDICQIKLPFIMKFLRLSESKLISLDSAN